MSAMPADGRGPDGRPDWLKRKHSRQAASPKLAAWADEALQELYGIWDEPIALGPFPDQQAARNAKNALYDACYKRWNRTYPDEPLSLSANLTDPKDGRCYARSTERCTQNGCQPTPGGFYVHARLYDKNDGRAHQAAKPVDSWDYDPMAPRRRSPAAATPRQETGPRTRFGVPITPAADSEDPAPAATRLGTPPSPGREKTRDVKTSSSKAEQQGIVGRLLRGQ